MIKQKENSDSKSLASFKKTSFLLAFLFTSLLTLSAADAQKDELKENLLGSEKKQKQAISTIKSSNREDLLPILSEILRTTSSEGELQGLILDLYFSYGTDIEKYNPNLLGKSLSTQLLKDYNGQTYWLTASPGMFAKKSGFPEWISLAVGYGAYGMLGGHNNNVVAIGPDGQVLSFTRERRFYISPDIDLSRIKVKNKLLKKTLLVLNMFKFPMPALEFTKRGLHFYPLYF